MNLAEAGANRLDGERKGGDGGRRQQDRDDRSGDLA